VSCDAEAGCRGTLASDPKAEAGFVVVGTGRLLGLCPIASGGAPEPRQCRALQCASAADCPPPQGLAGGVCINSLCVEPAHPVSFEDAVMLCSAGTGPGQDSPKQIEAHAMALQCGQPCKVPRSCRQP
jgi:hypothetical protein